MNGRNNKKPARRHRKRISKPMEGPLRRRPRFCVGILGHRPNRLKNADWEQLTSVVRFILKSIREQILTAEDKPDDHRKNYAGSIKAVSPLAEGSDRLFAEEALDLGYDLHCVMPFHQVEYERDFDPSSALEPDSLKRFRRLANRAVVRCELNGSRNDEGRAYSAVGSAILQLSNLLIVIWDGKRQGKQGGTEETLSEAIRMRMPIIWIDAHAPHKWQLVDATAALPKAGRDRRSIPQSGSSVSDLRNQIEAAIVSSKKVWRL